MSKDIYNHEVVDLSIAVAMVINDIHLDNSLLHDWFCHKAPCMDTSNYIHEHNEHLS